MRLTAPQRVGLRPAGMTLFAILTAVLLASAAKAGEAPDIIKFENRVIRGVVTEETYEYVAYTSGVVNGKMKQCEVTGIDWGDRSADFIAAETARSREEYSDAIDRYERALKSPLGRRFYVEPYCNYYIGTCYQYLGKYDEAEKYLSKVVRDYPKAKFFPYAQMGLGEMAMDQGQYDKAIESFSVVGKASNPDTGKSPFCDEIAFIARINMTDAMVGKKAYDQALTELASLIPEAERTFPDLSLSARRLKAETLVLKKQVDEGLKEYRDILGRAVKEMDGGNADKEKRLTVVAAQCYNGLGDAYLANGANRYKEALMEYLRVATVMGRSVQNEYPRALMGAAKCFDGLGQKDREKELVAELKRDYADYPGVKALK